MTTTTQRNYTATSDAAAEHHNGNGIEKSDEQDSAPHHDGFDPAQLKAAFFDVDGTLTSFTTHVVPDSAILSLRELKARGVKVFICSGRAPSNMSIVTDTIPVMFDGVIALNGQYCYDARGLISSQPLLLEDVQTITAWLDRHPDIAGNYCENDYTYFNRVTDALRATWAGLGKTAPNVYVEDPHERIQTHETYQISPFVDDVTQREIIAQCCHIKGERWNPNFVDLIPADGGKAAGMKRMLDHYGIAQWQTVAFGDGGNDASMLEFAGLGIAMGDATGEAKQAADYVTSSVDDDGVFNALRHFSIL